MAKKKKQPTLKEIINILPASISDWKRNCFLITCCGKGTTLLFPGSRRDPIPRPCCPSLCPVLPFVYEREGLTCLDYFMDFVWSCYF